MEFVDKITRGAGGSGQVQNPDRIIRARLATEQNLASRNLVVSVVVRPALHLNRMDAMKSNKKNWWAVLVGYIAVSSTMDMVIPLKTGASWFGVIIGFAFLLLFLLFIIALAHDHFSGGGSGEDRHRGDVGGDGGGGA